MSYQVGKKVKAVYQIARGEGEGGLAEFFIHDSTGAIVCTIITPHFADEETVAEFLTDSVFKPKDRETFVAG